MKARELFAKLLFTFCVNLNSFHNWTTAHYKIPNIRKRTAGLRKYGDTLTIIQKWPSYSGVPCTAINRQLSVCVPRYVLVGPKECCSIVAKNCTTPDCLDKSTHQHKMLVIKLTICMVVVILVVDQVSTDLLTICDYFMRHPSGWRPLKVEKGDYHTI